MNDSDPVYLPVPAAAPGALAPDAAVRLAHAFLDGRNERTLKAYRQDLHDFRAFVGTPRSMRPPACSWGGATARPTPWHWRTRPTWAGGGWPPRPRIDAWPRSAPWCSWPGPSAWCRGR